MRKLLPILLAGFFTFLVNQPLSARSLDQIKASGKIYVGFTTDDYKNINFPLAQEFAKYLNVQLVPVEIEWEQAFMQGGVVPENLETDPSLVYTPDIFKKVDLIASTFTVMEWRKKLFDFAETLFSAEILVVAADAVVKDYTDLTGKKIGFEKGTSFESNLNEINKKIGGGILLISTDNGIQTKQLLKEGEIEGMVLDADEALNYIAATDHKYKVAFPISSITHSAWAVEKANPLKAEIEDFFGTIASNGVLDDIFHQKFEVRYSSFIEKLNQHSRLEKYNRDLPQILESGKLVVALRERDFIYVENGPRQFMHALAEEFADYLGVSLEYVITPTLSRYWETENGETYKDSAYTPDWFNYFDVACELFAPQNWRLSKIDMVGIFPSDYSVIARRETKIQSFADLKNLKGVTAKGSVYEDLLLKNGFTNYHYQNINDFLPEVVDKKADYAILYNAFFELSAYPDLEEKLSLGQLEVSWGLRKDQPELKKEIQKFIRKSKEKGLISILLKALQGRTLQSPEAFINSYYESFQTGQLPYVAYGAEDGLPQEDILSIYQDKKGYIWFGTNSGVVRYNGREMRVLNSSQGLPDNSVRGINQDSTGILYFATPKGVAVFEHDTITDILFPNRSFHNVFVDKFNNKWLLGSEGIFVISPYGTQRHLNQEFPLLPQAVFTIEEDQQSGDKYLATSEGIYYFSHSTNQLFRLTDQDCFSLYIDIHDSIWASTKNGLLLGDLADLKTGRFMQKSRNLTKLLNFPGTIIKGISVNRFGSVWLITDSRIMQVLSTDQQAVIYEQEVGLKNNKILSFLIDREDNLWVGFSGGLQRLSNKKGLRNFYPASLNSYIYSIEEDAAEKIWITSNNGAFYHGKGGLTDFTPRLGTRNNKLVMDKLPNGNLLFANIEGMWEVNPAQNSIVAKRSFSQYLLGLENILITRSGEIYLLTGINGTIYYFPSFHGAMKVLSEKRTSNVFQLIEYKDQVIGGNSNGLVAFSEGNLSTLSPIDCNVWSLCADGDQLWIGTNCGLGLVRGEDFSNIRFVQAGNSTVIKAILPAKNRNYIWLGTNKGFTYFNKKTGETEFTIDSKDGLNGDEITPAGLFLDSNDLLWIGTYHGLSNFNLRARTVVEYAPVCYLERVLLNGVKINPAEAKTFRYNQNNFVFELSALSFSDEESIEYDFYLRGTANNYLARHKGREYKAYFNNLPPGDYEFIYRARGKNNIWGYAQNYHFSISKAWYNTWWFRILVIVVSVSIILAIYKVRVAAIEAQKKLLQQLVKERTRELEDANTEIEAQRDMATLQRDQIGAQKKEIEDSINYAERIQHSLLPQKSFLDSILPEYSILFKPRDVVSGDFYWAGQASGRTFITAADSTGHGVPGAFMSLLGMTFLNEIVNRNPALTASEVLNELRESLIGALRQEGLEGEQKDGMDMALCVFDEHHKTLEFAGANNPLYLLRNGELTEIKGDKRPVGIHSAMDPFSLHRIDLQKGDTVYCFSDGYADQFGGPQGKKFMYKQLKDLLLSIQHESMQTQKQILEQKLEAWKTGFDQVDDIVVIGLRF
jgi:ligand-binding sensor domain-containing protein/serine phosphatase RsbU (regulator of sigma subunit)/ABC-type amino acid transport substrate-binding protein